MYIKLNTLYFLLPLFIFGTMLPNGDIITKSEGSSDLMNRYQLNQHMMSFKNRMHFYAALVCGKCPTQYHKDVLERAIDDLLFYGNIILFCGAIWQLKRKPPFIPTPNDIDMRTGAAEWNEAAGRWDPL